MTKQQISFGDNVRIRKTQVTRTAGVAGLTGTVYGETTPSVTNIDVIGDLKEDYAIDVYFAERSESLWFTPELIELMDHGAGSVATISDVNKTWTRTESGEWDESPDGMRHKSFWKIITERVFGNKQE